MSFEEPLKYIGTLMGVALGWILTELSYIFRSRREDKKKLKKVLCNLLDIYHTINSNNPDIFSNLLIEKVSDKYPEVRRHFQDVVDIIKPSLKNFLNKIYSSEKLQEIRTKYESSVHELADTYPLLSYQLSGKSDLLSFDETFDDWMIMIGNKFSEDINPQTDKTIETLKTSIIKKKSLDVIEDSIKEVAWSINIRTWWKSKQTIKYIKETSLKKAQQFLDDYFTEVDKLMKESQ